MGSVSKTVAAALLVAFLAYGIRCQTLETTTADEETTVDVSTDSASTTLVIPTISEQLANGSNETIDAAYEASDSSSAIGSYPYWFYSGSDYSFDPGSFFEGGIDASSDGPSDGVLQAIANSANLTAQNTKCDQFIDDFLQSHLSYRKTQPVIPTTIEAKVILISLNDISDRDGIVIATVRLDLSWYDKRLALTGDYAKACPKQNLLTATNNLWFPYFLIQNGADTIFYPDAFDYYPSLLWSNGYVQWRIAFMLKLACDMSVTFFPFDTQECSLVMESPHFSITELNYTASQDRAVVLLSDDVDHPIWSIKGQAVRYSTRIPGIHFYMTFERKNIYYMYTIMIPMMAVVIQTAATFIIPANAEEKMSTAVSALMSYFFLFLLFVEMLPVTSKDSPAILVFIAIQILITMVVVLLSSVLGRLVCLEKADEKEEEEKRKAEMRTYTLSKSAINKPQTALPRICSSLFYRKSVEKPPTYSKIPQPPPASDKSVILTIAKTVRKRRIHSEVLNDIFLITFVCIVGLSTTIFIIWMNAGLKAAANNVEVPTTPMKVY